MIPSIDKGKHACQRVFPLLFALFALAGVSLAPKERRSAASARICRLRPPASQKPKNIRKYIAGRCGAVLPEQKWVQTRKDPQRILAVLSRGLTQYGHISARQNRVCPCQSMVAKQNSKVNGVFTKNVIITHKLSLYELCEIYKNEPLSPRNWKFHGRSRSAAPNTKNDIDGQTYDNTEQCPLHFLRYPVK